MGAMWRYRKSFIAPMGRSYGSAQLFANSLFKRA